MATLSTITGCDLTRPEWNRRTGHGGRLRWYPMSEPHAGANAGPCRSGPAENGQLARRLGTGDAVIIGLGSMVGAGVFAVFGPAAAAAGTGLLVGLVLAAMIA